MLPSVIASASSGARRALSSPALSFSTPAAVLQSGRKRSNPIKPEQRRQVVRGAMIPMVGIAGKALVSGTVIGEGVLGLVGQNNHELELLAHAGALLLLFAVGIELSLGTSRLNRFSEFMKLAYHFICIDNNGTSP